MPKRIFFILYIFLGFSLLAQQNKIDSLENIFFNNKEKNPQEALAILEQLYNYTYKSQPQKASEYIARATFICDSILKDSARSIVWKRRLAKIYFSQNILDLSMKLFSEIKIYYKSKGDSLNYAYSLLDLGNIYLAMDVGEIALHNFNEAKRIFLKNNDTTGLILVNNKIALVYYNNFQIDSAFKLLRTNLRLSKKTNNYYLTGKVYYNIAKIFKEELDVDSAENYYLQAVKFFKIEGKNFEIAEIYLELATMFIEENKLDRSQEYLDKAYTIFAEYGAEHRLAEVYLNYGRIFFLKKNYAKAEVYYEKALNIAFKYDLSNIKQDVYTDLAQIYITKKDYVRATEYLQMYIEERNSYFAKEKEQGFAQVILMFQNQEKQKEIELLEKKEALKNQQLKNKQQLIYASVIVIILLLGFAIFFVYSAQRLKKINQLLQEQNRKINLQKREIETQSRILEKATRDLLRQKQEIEEKNKKITASITYASRIQKAMLPSEAYFKKYFEDYFIFFKPKETVSGDFYWFSEVKDNRPKLFKTTDEKTEKVILAVVDCTGHGVPGAFMAMLGDAYLNQIVKIQHITEPDQILTELHKIIRQTLQQDETDNNDGMDMAVIQIDKKERIIKFSGAKNPLVYIQNGKMHRIHGDLMSIGGMQKEKERIFVKHTIDITAPTWVYLYTDGFQDQFGGKEGRKYMAKNFRDFLFKIHTKPFSEQKKLLEEELRRWRGKKYPQMDDITVIGIKL